MASRALPALRVPTPHLVHSRRGPLRETRTTLVELAAAPFPYDGHVPTTGRPFLDVEEDGRRGHRMSRGHVYWADETYNDARVLLHIPRGFDVRRPALLVVFFHGHGARLAEDVVERQQVPAQITMSGANAVLIAPQLAVDAADSSVGKLWQPGAFARLLDEAARQLAVLHGDPRSLATFRTLPVVIVAYSGGYLATAWSAHHGGIGARLRGVVLLDAAYGEIDKLADWISASPGAFFVSAYAGSTKAGNARLRELLKAREIAFDTALEPRLAPGTLAFLDAGEDASHRDFVTRAWAPAPVADLLSRLPGYRRGVMAAGRR